ncbi:hypothetical protein L6452_28723 [Arctium lappa]|uniref:Uncharacterized protein n=1 Tax=Arctium lappa TaxID=4217 RepID=A0ACB9A030_ARCLA|nr:hypothetical protein L6452_28723 [Arctium lappa]
MATTVPLKPAKMASETPVKIGTKGTVGSLMMKEIEYFNKLEKVQSQKHSLQVPEMAATTTSSGTQSKPKIDSESLTSKSKKRTHKFIPRMCAAIDVVDRNGPKMVSGFGYKTLKADVRRLQV